MAKKWESLPRQMSPQRQVANRRAAEQVLAVMPLDELRNTRNITQTHLAQLLNITQASVSKMEKRTDMYVSTLRSFVQPWVVNLKSKQFFLRARCASNSSLISARIGRKLRRVRMRM
jgi:DNA-binding XRE family transcriptional regulator